MSIKFDLQPRRGAIAILTLLGVTIFGLLVMNSLATAATRESQMGMDDIKTTQTFYAAEAGLNQALYKLITDPVPGITTSTLGDIDITTTIGPCEITDPLPCDPYHRKVESRAEDPSGKVRIVSLTASTSSFAGGFDSAVQAAAGGLIMDNGSCVIGNVYSNGGIQGPGDNNNGCKNSTATACRPVFTDKKSIVGKVTAALGNSISGVANTGDMQANTLISSMAGQHAYYQNISGTVKANNGAQTCNIVGSGFCHSGSVNPATRELPIKAVNINEWKDNITDSGNPVLVANAAGCPASKSTGYYCVQANSTLGNQKIDANFYVGNGATLTLNGNLWVTGNIILDNNGTIQIHNPLGGVSIVMIADGVIDVSNNYTMLGSGDPRSFIVMVSSLVRTADSSCSDPVTTRPAVCASNNSNSIVFAAPEGILHVKQNGCLNASATYKIHLEENSTVTYNPNIAYFTVGGGGGEQVGTALGSWKEK